MMELGDVSEYWFNNYFRVLVVDLGDNRKFISVDVYRDKWFFNNYEEVCVLSNEYCLLYSEVDVSKLKQYFTKISIDKVVVTGIRSGNVLETVNIRWFVTGDLDQSDVLKIFQYSWELINCKPPLDNPWIFECID